MVEDVILDVDPGIDDAYAISILVAAQNIGILHIVAILCSAGNTVREQACHNLIRILKALNATDIPIFEGAHRSILREPEYTTNFGVDAFGGMEKRTFFNDSIKSTQQFGHFIDVARKHKSITLLVFAPATLSAGLLMQGFHKYIKEIWIMGGNDPECYISQFSFRRDPEAVHAVLKHRRIPVLIVPVQICQTVFTSMQWRQSELGHITVPFMQLMNSVEKTIVSDRNEWIMPDAIMAAVFAFPEIVTRYDTFLVSVNKSYPTTIRSGVLYESRTSSKRNVKLIISVDSRAFKARVMDCIAQNIYADSNRFFVK